MQKFAFLVFTALAILFSTASLFSWHTQALSIVEGDNSRNNILELEVYSQAGEPVKAVRIRLEVSGAIIDSFRPSDDPLFLAIPTCDNGESHTNKEICLDVAATGEQLPENTLLGTISLFPVVAKERIMVSKSTENTYLTISERSLTDNGDLYPFAEVGVDSVSLQLNYLLLAVILVVAAIFVTAIIIYLKRDLNDKKMIKDKYHIIYNENNIAKLAAAAFGLIVVFALIISLNYQSTQQSLAPNDFSAATSDATVINLRALCSNNSGVSVKGDVLFEPVSGQDQLIQEVSQYRLLTDSTGFNLAFEAAETYPAEDVATSLSAFPAEETDDENVCLLEEYGAISGRYNSIGVNGCNKEELKGNIYVTYFFNCL